MSEELAEVVAVPDTVQSVTVDPALLNKPVRPEDVSTGSTDDSALKHKLGLANSHTKAAEKRAKEAETALAAAEAELANVRNAQTAATQKSLEEQGQYKQLWNDTKQTVSARDAEIVELKAKLASVTQ